MPIDIYQYDDYRLYLKDSYELKFSEDPSYSYRKFAKEAGFTNPGFLNDVIKGKRKLSAEAREKMVKVFSLSTVEAEFFRLLVEYSQIRKPDIKQQIYSRIVFRRNRSLFARLNPALSRYYQDYRYPLIRSAIMASDFRGDYDELGRFVLPPLPASVVKKYVRDLCDWGMVVQDSEGKYRVTDQFVEPPATLRDLVKQINREWIIQSLEPLMKLPVEKRHISTMLLSVSGETKGKIQDKIEEFREEIWRLVRDDAGDPDRIMQLNIQYFPKSRETGG